MAGRPPAPVLLVALASLSLAGCGLADPYARKSPAPNPQGASTVPAVTSADPAPERNGTIPARARTAQQRVAANAAEPTPEEAIRRFARLYVNWTAHDVAGVQRELASLSTGQARAQALQAATSYERDQTLLQSGVANSGQVVAISPSLMNPGQWVLVTSEQTTGTGDYSGLPPTVHVIYAQATRTPMGWVVSQWSPQN